MIHKFSGLLFSAWSTPLGSFQNEMSDEEAR